MDLTVGQKATRSITLMAGHVRAYAEMTGDYNPLHFDEDFASTAVTQLKMIIKRQNGEAALEGEAWCYTFCRE